MSLSMYDATVPVLTRGLGILSTYLDTAEAYASENNMDPAVLINARLAADMLPLAGQIQRASDGAKGGIARLAAIEAPSFPDTETTFKELKERVAKTIAFVKSVKPPQFEGSESRPIDMRFAGASGTLRGDRYLLAFLIPNFYFHVTTAHDILRHNGLPIGKRDYLGRFDA